MKEKHYNFILRCLFSPQELCIPRDDICERSKRCNSKSIKLNPFINACKSQLKMDTSQVNAEQLTGPLLLLNPK
jgi:hypothetical protein